MSKNLNNSSLDYQKLDKENKELKILLKECEIKMTDCLFKIYDEGGQSYPSLEEELKTLLKKVRSYLDVK